MPFPYTFPYTFESETGITICLRPALGAAKDIYLYPTTSYQRQLLSIDIALKQFGITRAFNADLALEESNLPVAYMIASIIASRNLSQNDIDTAFKLFGSSVGYGVEVLLSLIPARSSELNVDTALKDLSFAKSHEIDLALQRPNFTSPHQVDAGFRSTLSREVSIDSFLKALSVSELFKLDAALQKLGAQSNYHNDVALFFRDRVSLAIGVVFSTIPHMPAFFGIGLYLISQQKFDIAVAFEQLSVEPSFEGLDIETEFESFEVTPYFQEV